jgi:outer membrane receptor protein involved in Fe transport
MPFRARVERTVRSIDTAEPQADRRRARVTHITFGVHLAAGELRIGADVTYRSKTYFDDQNDTPEFILRNTVIDGLANAHVTWVSAGDRWEVSAWGKNITDTCYLVVASDLTPFYANLAEYSSGAGNKMFAGDWSPRGMFGISVTFKE